MFLAASARAENVRLFAPTDRQNPATGRADALRLELGEVPLTSLGSVLKAVRATLPDFDAAHPPEIPLYLARGRSNVERDALIVEILRQFAIAYPDVRPRIKVRYLDSPEANLKALSLQLDQNIDRTAAELPQDEITKDGIAALHNANREALKEVLAEQAKERSLRRRLGDPSTVRKLIDRFASMKALITLVTRGTQVWTAGFDGGAAPLLAGATLVGADTAIEYFGSRFEVQINKFFAAHPLPYKTEHPFWKRVNELYTSSSFAQFAKAEVIGIGVWGLLRPSAMQMAGHLNNPAIPAVGLGDLETMAKANVIHGTLYFAGFFGFENLRQKGWVSGTTVDLSLRLANLFGMAGNLAMSTGRPEVKGWLPLIMGPAWATFSAAFLASLVLPARNKRFVIVDPAIDNRADLNAIEALESTRKVDAASETDLASVVEEVLKLPRLGSFGSWLRESCRRGMSRLVGSR